MRINQKEISIIYKTLDQLLPSTNYHVYLFGSRADDTKKGGDIDLLLLCNPSDYLQFQDQKIIIKSHLEFNLDEQKVDLTIATHEMMKHDHFLISIANDLKVMKISI